MTDQPAIEAALAVMDAHIDALNAHDEAALAKTLYFPHIRLSSSDLKIWPDADSYFADFRARAGGNWHHSAFDDIKVLASSNHKVHLDAAIIRYDAHNNIINQFRSLWVIVRDNERWAAKMRSSFAGS